MSVGWCQSNRQQAMKRMAIRNPILHFIEAPFATELMERLEVLKRSSEKRLPCFELCFLAPYEL